jgi:hypothetical protein
MSSNLFFDPATLTFYDPVRKHLPKLYEQNKSGYVDAYKMSLSINIGSPHSSAFIAESYTNTLPNPSLHIHFSTGKYFCRMVDCFLRRIFYDYRFS